MLKTVAVIVVILVVALLAYAATRPDSFRIERTITINAPPTAIFPLIDDYHSWVAWSPWEKKDPAMQRTYGGASRGTGAVYDWSGNSAVGKGRMEIIQSVPPAKLVVDLHFMKPFEARNTAEFNLVDQGGATTVTWAMYGPSPYVSKLMGLFVNMDKMVGGDFEAGLAALKTVAEKGM